MGLISWVAEKLDKDKIRVITMACQSPFVRLPENFGSAHGSMIKAVKRALYRTLGNATVTNE